MRDEPVTTPELVAAYRDRERPSEAARERMARALMAATAARSATVIPLRPSRRQRRGVAGGWLALAAALALIGASSYWLVSARQQPSGPADMLLDAHDPAPAQGTVTPKASEAPGGRVVHAIAEPRATTVEGENVELVAATTVEGTVENVEPEAATKIEGAAVEVAAKTETAAADPAQRRAGRSQARQVAADSPRGEDAPADPVLEELMLIQQIKDALDAERPAAALAAIDAHARKFARGSLVEEREALRVVALCDTGEVVRGERAQRAFIKAYPRSAYRERVRAACPVAAAATEQSTID
ncbi:hypothetical protein OV079_32070 [Nannocystis pusilla]|uniref:Uncharacterized protein n=1 Tax=Nannocystis pusilla TaxID=889268 RepID=A0A9X3J0Z2_9BACT|nr:hypothetical protein [Nannocystis pusilla]MCY1010124.1 hypothetical protein [Nannocystis pusilla]